VPPLNNQKGDLLSKGNRQAQKERQNFNKTKSWHNGVKPFRGDVSRMDTKEIITWLGTRRFVPVIKDIGGNIRLLGDWLEDCVDERMQVYGRPLGLVSFTRDASCKIRGELVPIPDETPHIADKIFQQEQRVKRFADKMKPYFDIPELIKILTEQETKHEKRD